MVSWQRYRHVIDWVMRIRERYFLFTMIILYFFVVVLFATINWIIFFSNSTSFLISEQLNKSVKRYDFLTDSLDGEEYHSRAKDKMPITISGFSEIVNPKFAKRDSIKTILLLKQDTLSGYRHGLDSLGVIATEVRTVTIEHYKDSMMRNQQQRLDSINEIIAANDSLQMIRMGKYLERAHCELEYADKMQRVCSYVLKNYGKFLPDDLYNQIGVQNAEIIRLETEVTGLEIEERFLTRGIRDLINSFHNNRIESVGFREFLYYSICVSTTVSFGDIAPNDGLTRFLAVLEILLCVLLLGVFLNKLTANLNEEGK